MRTDMALEIKNRIGKLQQKIRELEINSVILIDRTNVYYFSGSGQQCHLYVPAEGAPLLMVKKNIEIAKKESPIANIVPLRSPKEILQMLHTYNLKLGNKTAMELDVLPTNNYLFYQKIFEQSAIVDVSPIVRDIRMIKSDFEVSQIRESGIRHGEVFKHISSVINEGLTDRELASAIEGYARKIGHLGYTRFRGFNVEFYMGHTLVGAPGAAKGPYEVMAAGGDSSNISAGSKWVCYQKRGTYIRGLCRQLYGIFSRSDAYICIRNAASYYGKSSKCINRYPIHD